MRGKLKICIVLLLVVIMTMPAFGMPAETGMGEGSDLEYASDRILIKFADNATATEKRSLRASYNLETRRMYNSGAESVMVKGNMPVEKLVEVLNRIDKVEYAELDHILRIPEYDIEVFPNDPYDDSQYPLWGMDSIDAPGAWAKEQGREEVIVAVIDTGIDREHIELDDNMWVNDAEVGGSRRSDDDGNGYVDDKYGWDFVNNDAKPDDDNGHGTHVAGTIAAEANKLGVVGVAPGVRVMALKCFNRRGSAGVGFESDVAAAIDYAGDKGAKIINASWGGGSASQTIKDAISLFGSEHGGIFVAAAGNGGEDGIGDNNDTDPHYPSSYNLTNIVAVASIDESGQRSDFSNFGIEDVDLFAPGGSILSTYPDNYLAYMSGTSMATPHVAGALALMMSHEMSINTPEAYAANMRTPEALITDLLDSTVKDNAYASIVSSGGRLNVSNALVKTQVYGDPDPILDPPAVTITSPSNGVTVSGSITLSATVVADGTVNEVKFFVDDLITPVGTDTDGSDGWSMTWDSTSVGDGGHEIRVEANDEYGTGDAVIEVTTENYSEAPTTDTFTSSIAASTESIRNKWKVTVTVSTDPSISGAEVTYRWDDGPIYSKTTSEGVCTISLDNLSKRIESLTFKIVNIEDKLTGLDWDSTNSDTEVTIFKPQ